MLTSLTPEERLAIYADAYLAYRREEADWSPTDATGTCRCERCAPPKQRPQRGTEAWRRDKHRQHATAKRRSATLEHELRRDRIRARETR